ncbi:glycine receptor subunit alpha-3 [Caerostris extrusa]|uniref:Glycine receptor subunit alpha-3 n=1 Tax=Caerostris extrusa TaxID=172846 RepID=A0AAV4N865_CAEEX|nr:glycine receptor subunit alpha-3 [Caerostris extrusa]
MSPEGISTILAQDLSPADRTCNSLIPDGYEMHKPSGKSTKVFTWVQIMDFGDINQANMDFLLHAFVINVWNDTRLQLDSYRGQERATILYPGCRQYVWTPQIFFETAKEAKSDETHLPSSQFKILPDGAVYLSTKYLFRAMCPMNLENYPFDTQTCLFKISLMAPNALNEFKWIGDEESPYKHERISVEMLQEPYLLLFDFKNRLPTPSLKNFLKVSKQLHHLDSEVPHDPSHHGQHHERVHPVQHDRRHDLGGLLAGVEHVPARVALSVTSLLTLCTQVHQYRTELPPVNYLKAMDIWLFVCIFIVFSTLVEFAVSYNDRNKQFSKESIKMSSKGTDMNKRDEFWAARNSKSSRTQRDVVRNSKVKETALHSEIIEKQKLFCNKIDIFCRYLYPILFTSFVIIYWIYYLNIYRKYS